MEKSRTNAFKAHVNHIAATAAAGVGKSCNGRRRMSRVGNAQFGNHDATQNYLTLNISHIWRLRRCWRIDQCKNVSKAQNAQFGNHYAIKSVLLLQNVSQMLMCSTLQKWVQSTKISHNTRRDMWHIQGGKVFWLQKSDQPHLSSSLRPDIDILRHNSQAVVHEGSGKHCIYEFHQNIEL